MQPTRRRRQRRLMPVGVVFEGSQAHLCALTDAEDARYVSVPRNRPERWISALRQIVRQAKGALMSSSNPLGTAEQCNALGSRSSALRSTRQIGRPLWLALEPPDQDDEPLMRVLSSVIPHGSRLSFVTRDRIDAFVRWQGRDGVDRFGRAEALASYVVDRRPRSESRILRRLHAGLV